MLKKIYTILVLITNFLIRRKHYRLHFVSEGTNDKRWYYDFKNWGFSHGNLEMVAGADKLCELYSNGGSELTIDLIASKKPIKNKEGYDEYFGEVFPKDSTLREKLMYGRTYYKIEKQPNRLTSMWICPVTLFVLGRYPNYLYVKKYDRANR